MGSASRVLAEDLYHVLAAAAAASPRFQCWQDDDTVAQQMWDAGCAAATAPAGPYDEKERR